MDRKAIVKIIAFAILDKYRPGAWKMANTDGRKQALGEAEAVVDALADVGLSIMPTPQSGECSRQPETAPDPQNTADCGEGNDRLGPVTSSDIQEPREYGMCADAEKLNDAAISKLSETPIDTAVGSMPNNVPPSTPGDDSAPAVEGTQLRFAKQKYGAEVATILETDDEVVEVVRRDDGTYRLTILNNVGFGEDRYDDLSANLTAEHFRLLGQVPDAE